MTDTDVIFVGANLADGSQADVFVQNGIVAAIEAKGSLANHKTERIDCTSSLLTPSFVEGHIHLDKTFLGLPYIPHLAGHSIAERVLREKELRATISKSVFERGGLLIEQVVASGTGYLRTHVDIDTEQGLSALYDLVRLREAYAHLVDMEIVVFPQSGILSDPGTADLLDKALHEGADIIGGLDPYSMDNDINGHLDIVFNLAEKHGVGVDIHLHDGGDVGLLELREIAKRTHALSLNNLVTVSHAFALGESHNILNTLDILANAGISILTNGPGTAPMPPVVQLLESGVNVFAGSDNIRDAWSPYGNGDMLSNLARIGYMQGMATSLEMQQLFQLTTENAAKALALKDYGLSVNQSADLVLTPAYSVDEAIASHPIRTLVMKSGTIVARNGVIS
jgi:cytosine deaminase